MTEQLHEQKGEQAAASETLSRPLAAGGDMLAFASQSMGAGRLQRKILQRRATSQQPPTEHGSTGEQAQREEPAGSNEASANTKNLEPSGLTWVNRFQTSKALDDLKGSFKPNCQSFVTALKNAGAHVKISATYRPSERAYLMHYSWLIAHGLAPTEVPDMPGANIDWAHRDAKGKPNLAAAKHAAQAMVAKYEIVYEPLLASRHCEGLAVDMNLTWNGNIKIHNKDGTITTIGSPHSGATNKQLHQVGATHGVIKRTDDAPHWSQDGI